jgi:hypothetical protein
LKAFSLLESLVVMFIIILLASVVVPGIVNRGKEKPALPVPKMPTKEKQVEEPREGTPIESNSEVDPPGALRF